MPKGIALNRVSEVCSIVLSHDVSFSVERRVAVRAEQAFASPASARFILAS
jgi:hypothetical protein